MKNHQSKLNRVKWLDRIAATILLLEALLIVISLLCSCTSYKEYDASTGQPTISFVTTGNIGFTTDRLGENKSETSGVNLLGGAFGTETASAAMENRNAGVSTRIGQLEIHGTIDNSTWVDTVGHWTWRAARSIVTGKVLAAAINGLLQSDLAKTSGETDRAALDAGVATNASDNATAVAGQQIAADAAVETGAQAAQTAQAAQAAQVLAP